MASFFNTIKKLIKNNNDDDSSDEDDYDFPRGRRPNAKASGGASDAGTVEAMKHVYQSGISGCVTSISFDNVQNTLCVGFSDGIFKIFGSFGNEITLRSVSASAIRKVILLTNTSYVVVVTENTLEKWDFQEGKVKYCLNFKNRISAIGHIFGVQYLYMGTDTGVVQIYNVNTNFLSSYTIEYPANFMQQGQNTPYPTSIKVSPNDNNFLLIGYSNGFVMVWNLECKRIEKPVAYLLDKERPLVSSICWSRKGTKFLVGTLNGDIYLFDVSKLNDPIIVHRSTRPENASCVPQQTSYTPIDQMEWLYTKEKKILLFKGTFQGNKSLILIKGDDFKDVSKLSTTMIQTNISHFTSVTSMPYANFGDVLGLFLVDQNNILFETKFNPRTNSFSEITPNKEIDIKSRLKDGSLELMETYEGCPTELLNILTSQVASADPNTSSFLQKVNLNSSPNNTFKLMISTHSDNSIFFWNITDVKSIQYLYHIQLKRDKASAIQSFTFIPKTYVLSVAFNNSNIVQIYKLTDTSVRIKSALYTIKPLSSSTSSSQSMNKSTDKLSDSTGSNSTPTNDSNNDPLPPPVFDVCKLFATIVLPVEGERVTSMAINPYRSGDSIRLVFGSHLSRVYHFILTFVDNRTQVDTPSKTVYSTQFEYQGSAAVDCGSIKSIIYCYVPLRENEDISIIHYFTDQGFIGIVDLCDMSSIYQFNTGNQSIQSIQYLSKRSDPIQYVFLNFDKYLDINSKDNSNNPTTPEQQKPNALVKCDDINLLVFSSKDIVLYNIPLSTLLGNSLNKSLNKQQQAQVFEHKKISKIDFKSSSLSKLSKHLSKNSNLIISLDTTNGQFSYYSINSDNQFDLDSSKTINGTIIKLPSPSISGSSSSSSCKLEITSDQQILLFANQFYTLVPGIMAHRLVPIFIPDIKIPPKPTTSTLTKLLFTKSEPKYDQVFQSEGTNPPLPTSLDKIQDAQRQVKFFADDFERIRQAMNERGEKLNELQIKTNQMQMESQRFAELTRQLKK